jgi:ferredoxin-NADP reductase
MDVMCALLDNPALAMPTRRTVVLALIHTFPFIVVDIQNGMMEMEWAENSFSASFRLRRTPRSTSHSVDGRFGADPAGMAHFHVALYHSGPLLRDGASLSPACEYRAHWPPSLRGNTAPRGLADRAHDARSLHILVAVFFLITLFLHLNWTLTSWRYIYATVAVSLATTLFRFGRTFRRSGLHGQPAHITSLDGTWLSISVPTKAIWRPGQHFFLRFLGTGAHAMTSHPFTVTSLPPAATAASTHDHDHIAHFIVRVRAGLTARLATQAGSRDLRVTLDGPYGGLDLDLPRFDRVVLLAGGSGIAFILGALAALERESQWRGRVDVVWSTRHLDTIDEVVRRLAAARKVMGDRLRLEYHATGDATSAVSKNSSDGGEGKGKEVDVAATDEAKPEIGRPDLARIVGQAFRHEGRLAVVCASASVSACPTADGAEPSHRLRSRIVQL